MRWQKVGCGRRGGGFQGTRQPDCLVGVGSVQAEVGNIPNNYVSVSPRPMGGYWWQGDALFLSGQWPHTGVSGCEGYDAMILGGGGQLLLEPWHGRSISQETQ